MSFRELSEDRLYNTTFSIVDSRFRGDSEAK